MCSIFSCLTVGVPEDGGRREKSPTEIDGGGGLQRGRGRE